MSDGVVLALTGPPAAGKSTVTGMLEDMGVPCKSTGDEIRDRTRRRLSPIKASEIDEDDYWETAVRLRDEHGAAGPTVACRDWIEEKIEDEALVCVSDLRADEEVEWLREEIGPTLVVRVDAPMIERAERYVDRELSGSDRSVVDSDRVKSLKAEIEEREERESPYPDHDLTLWNANDVSMHEVWEKLDNVRSVLSHE